MNLLECIFVGPAGGDPEVKAAGEKISIIKAMLLDTSSLMYRDRKSTVTDLLCQLQGEIARLTGYLAVGNSHEAVKKVAAAEAVLDIIARVLYEELEGGRDVRDKG